MLNGEIYNHPQLQARLRHRDHMLRTGSDTEVLVHLYEDFGEELVHALDGMFAFAIWDAARRRLVLARDRFGEKPLFYRDHAGRLAFASELTALTAAGGAGELDPESVDAYLQLGYVPGPRSILPDVMQLPPGHLLVWEPGGETRVSRYWSPPTYAGAPPEPRAHVVAELSELLERSTRSRMISDVPLGVFLSGGLDSTLIAALAERVAPGRVQTFTVGYDKGGVSEVTPARRVATALGTHHHEFVLTARDVPRQLELLAASLDQPIADQALVAMYALAQFARQRVTVAVGGEGADELFFGYPRYRWLSRAARLHDHLPAAAGRRAGPLAGRLPRRARRFGDVLAPVADAERHLDWVTLGRRHWRDCLYGPRLAEHRDSRAVLTRVEEGLSGTRNLPAALARFDQLMWLPDDVLAKADRAGMLASLEIRTPFLNHEIAELASSVPPAEHARAGGKALLRRVLDRARPGLLDNRPKTAFRVPAEEWLRGPLMPVLREQLSAGSLDCDGWIDRTATERLVSEHGSGADRSDVIWPLLVLGLWMDRFPAHA